jgi:two-component system, NtrC family, nitrogen regulation response regulator GlnG
MTLKLISNEEPLLLNNLSQSVDGHLRHYFAQHSYNLPPNGLYDRVLREVERPLIILSLTACKGNQLRAAEMLGINRNTLRKKIRDLDIPTSRENYRKAA